MQPPDQVFPSSPFQPGSNPSQRQGLLPPHGSHPSPNLMASAAGGGYMCVMSDLAAQLEFFLHQQPQLEAPVFIAKGAIVLGAVALGRLSSVWYNAVLRGDINRIVVGHHTNIQDNAVVHLADDLPCLIGHYVTIGHSAVVHACTIGNQTLIGMGAVVLDGAVVGNQCLIGAKALVTPGSGRARQSRAPAHGERNRRSAAIRRKIRRIRRLLSATQYQRGEPA
jgi:carbonic anhydrase/acetyltransferase-like protein (isoleucine patch superfamily)